MSEIIHNQDRRRFETDLGGEFAHLDYFLEDGILALIHTFVPPQFRNQGIAFALVKYALEYAKANDLKVYPGCSSVVLYIEANSEYQFLLSTED